MFDEGIIDLKKFSSHYKSGVGEVPCWTYWENEFSRSRPALIDICHETIRTNAGDNFHHIPVTDKNIERFVNDINPRIWDVPRVAQRADYFRYKLLNEYGGIWLDSDIVVFNPLRAAWKEFCSSSYDFGSTSHFGPGRPSIWLIFAKPNNNILTQCIKYIEDYLNKSDSDLSKMKWNEFGTETLWVYTEPDNYFHFDVRRFSPIPYTEQSKLESDEVNIESFLNHPNPETFVLFNETFRKNGSSVLNMSRSQLIKRGDGIGQIIRLALRKN